jgi:hypothetical protein
MKIRTMLVSDGGNRVYERRTACIERKPHLCYYLPAETPQERREAREWEERLLRQDEERNALYGAARGLCEAMP